MLLLGSGFCALVYQVGWLREFRLVFGASTTANAAVLAVFMGGLGVGSALLGRRADRARNPLRFYALLELGIAGSAALTPVLLAGVRGVYLATGGEQRMGTPLATVARMLLTALVLGVPTALMGGTLPAAARAVEESGDLGRRRLAALYGSNALGAVIGAGLATFVMLESLGTHGSVWCAAIANLVVAAGAWVLSSGMDRDRLPTVAAPARARATGSSGAPPPAWLALGAAAITGFVFLLMELVWYRMLGPLLGGTTYTFGLILAVALFGIGIGGLVYAAFEQRRPATLTMFGVTCALEAVCLAAPFAAGDHVAVWAAVLRPMAGVGMYGLVLSWIWIAALVVFPAAVVAGFQFPLLVGLLGRGEERVGEHTGAAYAWNTAGAITGSLAGGFGLLPLLSAPGVWRLAVVALVAMGVVVWVMGRSAAGDGRLRPWNVTLAVAAVLLLLTDGPTAAWRQTPIGAGRVNLDDVATPNAVRSWLRESRRGILAQIDGRESCLGIDAKYGIAFIVNGKVDGSARDDASTQVMQGLLPGFLHPHPRRALVVGLGTGSTAGWLGRISGMERVDVLELEPAVKRVAELCAPVNGAVLANPIVHVHVGDGREALLTSRARFDLIVSEPSNPYRAGVATLFTREFYRSAGAHLAPGGMFVQWLQAYETDYPIVRSVMATLNREFRVVELWETSKDDLLILASNDPRTYDVAALAARLRLEPFHSGFAKVWRAASPEAVFARYIGNEEFTRSLAAGPGPLNTDDRTYLEFAFARRVGMASTVGNDDLIGEARAEHRDRPTHVVGAADWDRVDAFRASGRVVDNQSPPELDSQRAALQHRLEALKDCTNEDFGGALQEWRAYGGPPLDAMDSLSLGEMLADAGDLAAVPLAEGLRASDPLETGEVLGRLWFRRGAYARATAALAPALEGYRSDPWPSRWVMLRAIDFAVQTALADLSQGRRLIQALDQPFSVHCSDDRRRNARLLIAQAVEGDFGGPLTHAALRAFEPNPLWNASDLLTRARCYVHEQDPLARRAVDDLREFRRLEPQALPAGNH